MTPNQLKAQRRLIAEAARRYYTALRTGRSLSRLSTGSDALFDEISDAHDVMSPSVRLSDALGVWS